MKEEMSDEPGRRLLHTRQVTCSGYLRDDGLIDIEGRLLDFKPEDSGGVYRPIRAGDPIHQMHVVMTVDTDFVIRHVRAVTQAAPTPDCGQASAAYSALIGMQIGPGFNKMAAERIGREGGCTHLTELLGPMGTTLVQSSVPLRLAEQRKRVMADENYVPPRPFVIGTCHAYREGGEAAKRLEDHWRQWRIPTTTSGKV